MGKGADVRSPRSDYRRCEITIATVCAFTAQIMRFSHTSVIPIRRTSHISLKRIRCRVAVRRDPACSTCRSKTRPICRATECRRVLHRRRRLAAVCRLQVEACHLSVGDAAGHDPVELAQVCRHIECEAVRSDSLRHMHADGGDLFFCDGCHPPVSTRRCARRRARVITPKSAQARMSASSSMRT